jgi:hypothetical protein
MPSAYHICSPPPEYLISVSPLRGRVGAIFGIVGGVLVLLGYLLPFVSVSTGELVGDANPLLALAALVVISTSARSAWGSRRSPRRVGLCFAAAVGGLLSHLGFSQLVLQIAGYRIDASFPTQLAVGFWFQLLGCFLMVCGAFLLIGARRTATHPSSDRPDPL